MLRKIGFGLLCAASLFSTSTYSMVTHQLQQGVTIDFDMPPSEPQLLINYLFWTVEAHCVIKTEDESDDFTIVALAKKGKINDIALAAGESLQMTVYPDDNLKITADSGAKVEITNYGAHTVKVSCTA